MTIPFDQVEDLIREVAATEIVPRFRRLADDEIMEKSPGDVVTVADHASEARLSAGLLKIMPDAVLVGEEMTFDDASVLDRLNGSDPVWVIDPLDGTGNFASGNPAFAVMVALVKGGETQAGWIYDPLGDRMAVAERGRGCRLNGEVVRLKPAPAVHLMHGGILTRFLPDDLKGPAEESKSRFAHVSATMCAGHEYLSLLEGDKHFVLYYRTLPWDHAAGALMTAEAGGHVARLDGSDYKPADGRTGLLEATDADTWTAIHDLVVPGVALI
ncbi:MAG: inositol monophosphatase [Rhodospirillales bacterium]|nr:inositol monophosphatase [Rhodospirillales bacterium]MBT4038822.1 inositol monophosphatase [Rhodospirillales bacterium]MBT4625899.1 inositol monophosphatase [Rhodospirillales bacterium]MBT5352335.1 inositol monophosphatase [Rhodospirillales bacterium]MBT5520981.1 inositol monophosphatase [Rhodospirillales bacterium]